MATKRSVPNARLTKCRRQTKMANADSQDQWLLSGDCKKCRRKKYCSKPCTKNMNTSEAMARLLFAQAMFGTMSPVGR